MSAPTVTSTIPTENLSYLQDRIAKLNRRAARLGVAPVVLTAVEAEPKRIKRDQVWGDEGWGEEESFVYIPQTTVTVTGETPKLAGWRLAAVIDLSLEEPLFNRVPGETVDLESYRNGSALGASYCEHCRTKRRRQETFVLANEEDGVLVQVGRNCLADFLGGVDPARLVALADFIREWAGAIEDAERRPGSGRDRGVAIGSFLAMTSAVIERWGWLSSTKARELADAGEPAQSTVSEVWWNIFPPTYEKYMSARERERRVRPTEKDRERADAALAWARAIEHDAADEYLRNLGRACRAAVVSAKHGGLVASAVSAWRRAVEGELKAKRRAERPSAFVGEVGQRFRWVAATKRKPAQSGLTLTLLYEPTVLEGQWGATFLHKFEDPSGNQLTWFGSSRAAAAGETIRADATVKAHEVYKGVNQTILTRVSVLETPAGEEAR